MRELVETALTMLVAGNSVNEIRSKLIGVSLDQGEVPTCSIVESAISNALIRFAPIQERRGMCRDAQPEQPEQPEQSGPSKQAQRFAKTAYRMITELSFDADYKRWRVAAYLDDITEKRDKRWAEFLKERGLVASKWDGRRLINEFHRKEEQEKTKSKNADHNQACFIKDGAAVAKDAACEWYAQERDIKALEEVILKHFKPLIERLSDAEKCLFEVSASYDQTMSDCLGAMAGAGQCTPANGYKIGYGEPSMLADDIKSLCAKVLK